MVITSQGEAETSQLFGSQGSEFVALKTFLETVSSSFEHEALNLESEARIFLEKLSSNTHDDEPVRKMSNSLVSLGERVRKVRDEQEHLLNKYTSEFEQKLENSSNSYLNKSVLLEEINILLKEMTGTRNKIITLEKCVDDITDKINKKLNDYYWKHLFYKMATLVMYIFIAINVFVCINNNITMELIKDEEAADPRPRLFWPAIGTFLASLFLFACAIGWSKFKRLA